MAYIEAVPEPPEPPAKSRAKPESERRLRADGELDQRRGSLPGKAGTPAFEATDQQRQLVKSMAGYGMRHRDIAKAMGFSEDTLERHFRPELDLGFGQAAANLSQTMYGLANGLKDPNDPEGKKYLVPPSEKMLTFALERKFGFEATERRILSGPNNGPIQTEDVTDSMVDRLAEECSPEELALLERVFARRSAASADKRD